MSMGGRTQKKTRRRTSGVSEMRIGEQQKKILLVLLAEHFQKKDAHVSDWARHDFESISSRDLMNKLADFGIKISIESIHQSCRALVKNELIDRPGWHSKIKWRLSKKGVNEAQKILGQISTMIREYSSLIEDVYESVANWRNREKTISDV